MARNNSLMMSFNDEKKPPKESILLEKIIRDRGSLYSVFCSFVEKREDVKEKLKKLKSKKKYQKATHHSFAVRISKDGSVYETKSDDGETGAGNVILRILQKRNYTNILIVVTRWYGGVHLGPDRFKHIQDATVKILDTVEEIREESKINN